MNKLLSIIISVILLVVLTSCEQNPTTTKYEPPPDEDASGVSQLPVTEDTFTSDYLPGEENREPLEQYYALFPGKIYLSL